LGLYHFKSPGPATYVAIAIVRLCIALFACYVPPRRATNVDPMTVPPVVCHIERRRDTAQSPENTRFSGRHTVDPTSPLSDEVVAMDLTTQPVTKLGTILFQPLSGTGNNQPDAMGGGDLIVDGTLPVACGQRAK